MEILQLLETSPVFFIIATGILGLVVGSFLNVVIYRLPIIMHRAWTSECREHLGDTIPESGEQTRFNLLTPASRCPHCNHRISALENIPVLSYAFLKGRCAECGTAISPRYPAIELATALLVGHHGIAFRL